MEGQAPSRQAESPCREAFRPDRTGLHSLAILNAIRKHPILIRRLHPGLSGRADAERLPPSAGWGDWCGDTSACETCRGWPHQDLTYSLTSLTPAALSSTSPEPTSHCLAIRSPQAQFGPARLDERIGLISQTEKVKLCVRTGDLLVIYSRKHLESRSVYRESVTAPASVEQHECLEAHLAVA